MTGMTIGQIARKAGTGVETIRFYEKRGLIPSPARRSSGYREYPPDTVRRLRFIRHAKDLGFTLNEIQDILALRIDPESTCEDVRLRARSKISDIDQRIAQLVRIKESLERIERRCRGQGPSSECPILEVLDQEERKAVPGRGDP